jgi:predicted nuclease of predicted toxin-antitoxin system
MGDGFDPLEEAAVKVLLDSCVWAKGREAIAAAGHDVVTVADYWADDPGDRDVLERARAEDRVLVTIDKDFGQLIIVNRLPHCGVIRLEDVRATQHGTVCVQVLAGYEAELQSGALIVASPTRVRVRMPEAADDAP